MKKILLLLLSILMSLSIFTACGGNGDDGTVEIPPEYASEYTYNDTHHWQRQLNGVGSQNYQEHQNDSGKCFCGYYFKCPNLVFEKKTIREVNTNITGYVLVGYNGLDENAYEHVEIPSYIKPEGSDELQEVIAIAPGVFSTEKNVGYKSIKSIKISEGIKYIGNGAFASTDIEEITIPNTVIGGFDDSYTRMENLGAVFGLFDNCTKLKKAVIGNNIITIGELTFNNCTSLEKVVFGSMVREIRQLAFQNCTSLKQVVLNSSIRSIPESSYHTLEGWKPLIQVFPSVEKVYFNCSRSDYNLLLIEPLERDIRGFIKLKNGTYVDPENYVLTSYGIVMGWCGDAELYYEGDWAYDSNGNPYSFN